MGRRLVALLLLFLPGFAQKVRVVAASDLQYALPEVARAFERENPGVKVELVFGSSGKLYAQLTQGLEADLFFSADKAYPELLEQRGLAEPGTRKPYALGRVVLWVDRKLGLKPGPEAGPFMEKLVAHTRKVDGPTIVQVGFLQPDGRVLVAEAARGMTTRFDPATYGAFARDPACAGVQIDAAAPAQPPQRKFGPRG